MEEGLRRSKRDVPSVNYDERDGVSVTMNLIQPIDERVYYSDIILRNVGDINRIWNTLYYKYIQGICRHKKSRSVQEYNITLLWSKIPEQVWKAVMQVQFPLSDGSLVEGVDLRWVRHIVQSVQKIPCGSPPATSFVKVADVWVQILPAAPLWWIPLDFCWVRKDTHCELRTFHHVHDDVRSMMVGLTSLQAQSFSTDLVLTSSLFHALSINKLACIKFYKPMHRIFVMRTEDAGWGLFIGIEQAKLDTIESGQVLVPGASCVCYMTGEVTMRKANDNYAVSIGTLLDKRTEIVCTCWYGENMPIIGGAGFFANHSCSENRLLLPIQQSYLQTRKRKLEANETAFEGQNFAGVVVYLSLARSLTKADFDVQESGPPRNKDGLSLQTIDVDGVLYRMLPLETDYGYTEGRRIKCACLTRCWYRPEHDRDSIWLAN